MSKTMMSIHNFAALLRLLMPAALMLFISCGAPADGQLFPSTPLYSVTSVPIPGARYMAALCTIAYCSDFQKILQWSCPRCQTFRDSADFQPLSVNYDSKYDVFMYAGYAPSLQAGVIVFRGTNGANLDTWYRNFDFKPVEYPAIPNATVHYGFYNLYTSSTMQRSTKTAAAQLLSMHNINKLIITGHSLGGAFTTLAAAELGLEKFPVSISVLTYGSPRVGNPAFADAFNAMHRSRSWRFVNNLDPVPSLPPASFGFRHVATEVYEQFGLVRICDNSGEDPTCQNQFCGPLVPCPNAVDHLVYLGLGVVSQYVMCLGAGARGAEPQSADALHFLMPQGGRTSASLAQRQAVV